MSYEPKPIDTSRILLTPETRRLTEILARNTHDTWARLRIEEGWRYGPTRNDETKEHPDLVPYEDLRESEKNYDRRTAVETIKLLVSLGYSIETPELAKIATTAAHPAQTQALDQIVASLGQASRPGLPALLALWRARDPAAWSQRSDIHVLLGEKLLQAGEPLLAYDVTQEGLSFFPDHVRLRQLRALSLARSGASRIAQEQLLDLQAAGHTDEETLCMLARTYKSQALASPHPADAKRAYGRAYELYGRAYKLTQGSWSGINTATLALVMGRTEQARILAAEVQASCLAEVQRLESSGGDRYWPLATLGEAALILGEWAQAEDWYSRASELARGRHGDLASSRRNARLLMDHLDLDRTRIDRCFRIPAVAVLTGHMIDRPDRSTPRFPPSLEQAVKDSIHARLKSLDAGFGFASAACGSDILFLEAILERGGETSVVLPCDKEQFIQESVERPAGAGWVERFERLLEHSTVMIASRQKVLKHGVSYDYTALLLQGLAGMRAAELETPFVPIAVWDRMPGDGPGGTAATIERWRGRGYPVEIIDLARILSCECPDLSTPMRRRATLKPAGTEPDSGFTAGIRGLLFADAVGFSSLTETQVPLFVRHFIGLVGRLVREAEHPPLMKNTWGDGLYFVFENVRDAGLFALELCDRVRNTDWSEKGLPGLSLRIGLHAGPVYACVDPVTAHENYIGVHVSRAARIEPITPPGHVYASQAFSALAVAEGVQEFVGEYVGQVALAKKFGTFPIYLINRRG